MEISNTNDMRQFLISCMKNLVEGRMDSIDAKAICNLSQQVYNMTNLEIRYAQTQAKVGEMRLKPLGFNNSSQRPQKSLEVRRTKK